MNRLLHARTLLASDPRGATAYPADIRSPGAVLSLGPSASLR
jgi:hypothetical protein